MYLRNNMHEQGCHYHWKNKLGLKAVLSIVWQERTYRAVKHKGVFKEQAVVLSDRKVVHHDRSIDLVDGHISDDLAILVCHTIMNKGSLAAVVSNEDHLACNCPHRP